MSSAGCDGGGGEPAVDGTERRAVGPFVAPAIRRAPPFPAARPHGGGHPSRQGLPALRAGRSLLSESSEGGRPGNKSVTAGRRADRSAAANAPRTLPRNRAPRQRRRRLSERASALAVLPRRRHLFESDDAPRARAPVPARSRPRRRICPKAANAPGILPCDLRGCAAATAFVRKRPTRRAPLHLRPTRFPPRRQHLSERDGTAPRTLLREPRG